MQQVARMSNRRVVAQRRTSVTVQSVPQNTSVSYLPGLNGLRAIAVFAVLLYHADTHWLPGGFLGVDVFFVISGYLITVLLLAEWQRHGRIDLRAFWLRRARRLLPALVVMIVTTLTFALAYLPRDVVKLRGDALAALLYITNWHFIFGHQSYFAAAGRPSLFQHLWSLAVEEQFYILWPLFLVMGMRHWQRRRLLLGILCGATVSTLLMAVLYRPGFDPSRLYYGTDTRAAAPLIGAALAFIWMPGRSKPTKGWLIPLLLDVLGLGALAWIAWNFYHLGEWHPFLYRGGFALVALLTAVVIAVAVHPRGHLGSKLLEWRPLTWLGVRSYSIYLWHWPVFMITRPQLDVPLAGLPLLIVRVVVTCMLAELSYRCIEEPIRSGAITRAWTSWREARGAQRYRLSLTWVGIGSIALSLSVALGVAVAEAKPPPTAAYLSVMELHISLTRTKDDLVGPLTTPAPTPITAIGDSVLLGMAAPLEQTVGPLDMDAEIGLQVPAALELIRARHDAGRLGNIVLLHLGNNGVYPPGDFDAIMQLLRNVQRVVVVNVKVPRSWEAPNNAVLATGVPRYPNAVLVDWRAASENRPDLFWDDGVHVRPSGASVYVDLINTALKAP